MPPPVRVRTLTLLGLLALLGCRTAPDAPRPVDAPEAKRVDRALASDSILTAGVAALDRIYNTELVAPYDVSEHTYYRDSTRFVAPFIVSPDGSPVTTCEGMEISPHYSFAASRPPRPSTCSWCPAPAGAGARTSKTSSSCSGWRRRRARPTT